MKTLIVFEDTDGISDIYKVIHGITEYGRGLCEYNEDIILFCGAACVGALALNRELIAVCNKYDIEQVISVFDIDNSNGFCNTVYTPHEFKMQIDKFNVNTKGKLIHKFMPVVYNAETVMLYQYIVPEENSEVVDIVHNYDTKVFHLKLLEELVDYKNTKISVKHIAGYLDVKRLYSGLRCVHECEINYPICNWILNGMPLEDMYFLSDEEVQMLLISADKKFRTNLTNKNRMYKYKKEYYFDISSSSFQRPVIKKIIHSPSDEVSILCFNELTIEQKSEEKKIRDTEDSESSKSDKVQVAMKEMDKVMKQFEKEMSNSNDNNQLV